MLAPTRHGASARWIVVGLGNPGAEYEGTRHNVGADTVALLARRAGERLRPGKGLRAEVAEWRRPAGTTVLAFPQTYMNDSGLAVGALLRRYGPVELDRLIVVHDELDLPPGRVRLKLGGGTAGHNGLKSIQAHVHGNGFVRVRIGIGKPPGRREGADHVLRRAPKAERAALEIAVEVAADAVTAIGEEGLEAVMTRVNAVD